MADTVQTPMRDVDLARAAGRQSFNLLDELGISFGNDNFQRVNPRQMSPAQAAAMPAPAAAPARAPAVPADLTFGSAMGALPKGTTAQGGLAFSPITVYSPEQQRVQAMSKALAGLPAVQLGQLMQALPQRGEAPSIKERASETYYDRTMRDYMASMAAATSREEQLAAENRLSEDLITLMGGNAFAAPVSQ